MRRKLFVTEEIFLSFEFIIAPRLAQFLLFSFTRVWKAAKLSKFLVDENSTDRVT
jgi:hypothetical protein